ncbi:MAG: rRNA maturation RNase YbeY, partial [Clostridia bacterium]|nr:rRNA maturation RNase YbeY [Clostridia bacterium]
MLKIYCEDYDFTALAEAFAGEVEADCGLSAEIIFTDGEEIRRLNRETRNTDAVTDVLSFPSLDGIKGKIIKKADFPADIDEEGRVFIGSIAICSARAMEQAEDYGLGYERELY